MIESLIFDFDGVVVVTESKRFKILQGILGEFGIDMDDGQFPRMIGRTNQAFLDELGVPAHLMSGIDSIYDQKYRKRITEHAEPVPAVVDFIRKYNGKVKLALASMSTRQVVRDVSDYLGILEKFDVIMTREQITNHKPDPEIYLTTARILGILPSNCGVVEDSAIGAKAGINAGMRVYGLLNGVNNETDFAGLAINGLIRTREELDRVVEGGSKPIEAGF